MMGTSSRKENSDEDQEVHRKVPKASSNVRNTRQLQRRGDNDSKGKECEIPRSHNQMALPVPLRSGDFDWEDFDWFLKGDRDMCITLREERLNAIRLILLDHRDCLLRDGFHSQITV